MTSLHEIEVANKIQEEEMDNVTRTIVSSFVIHTYADSSAISKQLILIDSFSKLIEKYLELRIVESKQNKLEFIHLMDKLNTQKELLEIEMNKLKLGKIKKAGKRLGKKSQSAFETKPK